MSLLNRVSKVSRPVPVSSDGTVKETIPIVPINVPMPKVILANASDLAQYYAGLAAKNLLDSEGNPQEFFNVVVPAMDSPHKHVRKSFTRASDQTRKVPTTLYDGTIVPAGEVIKGKTRLPDIYTDWFAAIPTGTDKRGDVTNPKPVEVQQLVNGELAPIPQVDLELRAFRIATAEVLPELEGEVSE